MHDLTLLWPHPQWELGPARRFFLWLLMHQMRSPAQAFPLQLTRVHCVESLAHCTSPLGCRGTQGVRQASEILAGKFYEGSAACLQHGRAGLFWKRPTGKYTWNKVIHCGLSTHSAKPFSHSSAAVRLSPFSRCCCRQQHTLTGSYRSVPGSPPAPLWRVALVGRANVGKSSLYNRFLMASCTNPSQQAPHQLAIVGPDPGTTRDRKESLCSWGPLSLLLMDTPGIETNIEDAPSKPVEQIREQVARALAQSDIILFIVDAREGITPIDEMFARQLRVLMEEQPARGGQAQCHIEHHQREPSVSPSRSPSVILVLNKAEGVKGAECIGDAYELQLGHPVAVSTRTKQGFDELYERLKEALQEQERGQRPPSVSLEQENMRDASHRKATATEAWLQGLSRRYGRGVQPTLAYKQPLEGCLHLPWSLTKATLDGGPSEGLERPNEKQDAGEKARQKHEMACGECRGDEGVPLHDTGEPGTLDEIISPPEIRPLLAPQDEEIEGPIRVTFIGRPNAGKSSLINSILKENRLKASATPGTTTDSICVNFFFKKQQMALIDTAGVTKGWKMRGDDMLQQASLQTMRNIRSSDVCILCLDAARVEETGHLSSHDLSLANLATEKEGRSLVVCVTKWDLVDLSKQSYVRRLVLDRLQTGLGHLKACPVVFTSATEAQNLNTLLNKSCLVYKQWCSRVPTGTLNSWLQQYTAHWPPPWRLGSQCQVKYITQVQAKPPTFVAWSNVYAHFPTHYKRQLINAIREEFGLKGIPVRLVLRTTAMPKPGAKLTKAEALKWKRLGPHQYMAATKLSRKYVVKKNAR